MGQSPVVCHAETEFWMEAFFLCICRQLYAIDHRGLQYEAIMINLTLHFAVAEITVLCHFRQNDLMPVIICKSDKHLVTLYNVIFRNMTGILSHLSYILAAEMKCIGKPICQTNTQIVIYLKALGQDAFLNKWDTYNMQNE